MLPGATNTTRYTVYANNVTVLMTSSDEVSKEIGKYEGGSGAKINCEKSVSLRLGSWMGCSYPASFRYSTSGPLPISS